MQIDVTLIDRLAELSRLQFEGEEKEAIRADLEKILTFIEQLNEVNTDGVEPLIHMTDGVNVFRKDEARIEITHEEALKNAPVADSDYFKVPRVVKK